MLRCWGVLLSAVWMTVPAAADVIELTSGQKLQGDVLKESSDVLYIDVGVDVVRVPLNRIKSRTKGDQPAQQPRAVRKTALYSSAELPVRSVKELARQFGAGVVLVQTPGGLGSGFLLNEQGYCVTNYHVVEKETRIAVTVFDQQQNGEFRRRRIESVEIAALNPFFDLALLKLPPQKDLTFRSVYLLPEAEHREGDEVFAIGNPLGLERTVSKGIVSTRNRNLGGLVYIQTTTQINPGNSGGPLFNARGQVIGVTSMKVTAGEGIAFAIPVSYLLHFLDNRDAFAFDKTNANSGQRYLEAPRRRSTKTLPRP